MHIRYRANKWCYMNETVRANIELILSNWKAVNERPKGPFRVIRDQEYTAAFITMIQFNRTLHNAAPSLKGYDFHEIHPVKFGGNPTDPLNKTLIPREQHLKFANFWNSRLYELKDSL